MGRGAGEPPGPVSELRLLTIHRYQPGLQKLSATPLAIEHLGRRGKPVQKMRLIHAEKAFAFAHKLWGTPGCTVLGESEPGGLRATLLLSLRAAESQVVLTCDVPAHGPCISITQRDAAKRRELTREEAIQF